MKVVVCSRNVSDQNVPVGANFKQAAILLVSVLANVLCTERFSGIYVVHCANLLQRARLVFVNEFDSCAESVDIGERQSRSSPPIVN